MRVDYTVAMLIGTSPVSITSPNFELIQRVYDRWTKANPLREVTLFANLYH